MKYPQVTIPLNDLKSNAPEIILDITENQQTIITRNGEAKAVVQDIRTPEETQDSLAMLKILALSTGSIQKGKYQPAQKSFKDFMKKIRK